MRDFLKRIIFPILCVFCFANHQSISHSKERRFNASVDNQSVLALSNELTDNENEPFENTYAATYFLNLRKNFPINTHGTCSYVAISMLLSFFDSYWDDSFVDERFEKISVGPESGLFHLESPGVICEPLQEVQNLTASQYCSYSVQNRNNTLQSHLISKSVDFIGSARFETDSNPFGLSRVEQTQLIHNYFYDRYISSNTAIVHSFDDYNGQLFDSVVDFITDGTPVILNIFSSIIGYHSVIAYDYNFDSGEIFVHPGWNFGDNSPTHISLSQLGVTLIDSAVVIEISNDHVHSNNYMIGSYHRCSCYFISPENVSCERSISFGMPAEITWKSLYEEKWYRGSLCRIAVKVFDPFRTCVFDQEVLGGNRFLLNGSSFHLSGGYRIEVSIAGESLRNFGKSSTYFYRPPEGIPYTRKDISPSSFISCSLGNNSEFFESHRLADGYLFKTRSVGARYLPSSNEVVLSPSLTENNSSYMEYQFKAPIYKLDVELSVSRCSQSYQHVIDALIQTWRYGSYENGETALNISNESFVQSSGVTSANIFSIDFIRPITRFRIYFSIGDGCFSLVDEKLCIGPLSIYEVPEFYGHDNIDMAPSGAEIEYSPQIWNLDSSLLNNNNCYAYAFNFSREGIVSPGDVGFGSNNYLVNTGDTLQHFYSCDMFFWLTSYDSRPGYLHDNGFIFRKIEYKEDELEDGFYRVALVFDHVSDFFDYHWYRQNPDGTWSHKPGNTEVRDWDYDGNPILDPEYSNRRSATEISDAIDGVFNYYYSEDVYFFEVKINEEEVDYEENFGWIDLISIHGLGSFVR